MGYDGYRLSLGSSAALSLEIASVAAATGRQRIPDPISMQSVSQCFEAELQQNIVN